MQVCGLLYLHEVAVTIKKNAPKRQGVLSGEVRPPKLM